jgi:hypothetical protein
LRRWSRLVPVPLRDQVECELPVGLCRAHVAGEQLTDAAVPGQALQVHRRRGAEQPKARCVSVHNWIASVRLAEESGTGKLSFHQLDDTCS